MSVPSALEQLTAVPLDRPCEESWDQMVGDDRVRHCGSCARDVYDLSAMSAREANARLLNAADREPCIRYARLADGTVLHAAEPRHLLLARSPSRRFVAAAALGVTLTASAAQAKTPKASNAPAQCAALVQQSDIDAMVVAAAKPAEAPLPGTSAFAEAPSKAAPPPEPRPIRLAGKPMPMKEEPAYGTLAMKSKVAREVTIVGIKLQAPFDAYLLGPGDFIADVKDPDGTTRSVKLKITRDKTTTIDLDRKKR